MSTHIKHTLTLTMLLAVASSYALVEQHYTDADWKGSSLNVSLPEIGGDNYWLTYSGSKSDSGGMSFYWENTGNNLIEIGKDSSGAVVPTTLDIGQIHFYNGESLPSSIHTTVVNYATLNASNYAGFQFEVNSGSLDFINNGSISAESDGALGILIWPYSSGAMSITNNGSISGSHGISNNNEAFYFDTNLSIINSVGASITGTANNAIYLQNNDANRLINISVENSGTISSLESEVINIYGMNNVSIRNTETGVISNNNDGESSIVANRVNIENAGRAYTRFNVHTQNGGRFINTGIIDRASNSNLHIDNQSGDFLFQNFGTIGFDGYTGDSIYINGMNVRFEQKGILNGQFSLEGSNNTLALYTRTEISEFHSFNDGGNTLEIVISDADNYGALIAGSIEMVGADLQLIIDAENAFLELGDVLTIIHTDEDTLSASFANVSDGDTIQSGNYEFLVNYDGQDITLTVTQVIPEASTYAAIFGALALAFAAYRRRK